MIKKEPTTTVSSFFMQKNLPKLLIMYLVIIVNIFNKLLFPLSIKKRLVAIKIATISAFKVILLNVIVSIYATPRHLLIKGARKRKEFSGCFIFFFGN